jgi:hypothetical protein
MRRSPLPSRWARSFHDDREERHCPEEYNLTPISMGYLEEGMVDVERH